MRNAFFGAGVCLAILALGAAMVHPARATSAGQSAASSNACDRACLYGFLDLYLEALKAKDPSRVPWAKSIKYSENNVAMKIGDGVWGTITGLGAYNLRTADTTNGQVGFYGIVQETRNTSAFALRLKVEDRKISEAEVLIHRSEGPGSPFPSDPKLVDKPVLNEILPPEARRPRERMISIADGYWSTLQLNDGQLFTEFADDCNRVENGLQTTHNPDLVRTIPVAGLGCAEQFKLGNYRYDDRVRDRRFPLVDEERGLVMSAAFLDHAGRLGKFVLTDGRVIDSPMKTPSTLCALELFKIRDGKIQQVETIFIGVPYNMPSPWVQY
ncbi:MAG TPA: hypothetical protein VJO53_14185 [Candidatus Acidoferrales bacterium]|nr:hypothetical protein [Candidatus Acidoferrales bacterium]